jgi:hypothetical protein
MERIKTMINGVIAGLTRNLLSNVALLLLVVATATFAKSGIMPSATASAAIELSPQEYPSSSQLQSSIPSASERPVLTGWGDTDGGGTEGNGGTDGSYNDEGNDVPVSGGLRLMIFCCLAYGIRKRLNLK